MKKRLFIIPILFLFFSSAAQSSFNKAYHSVNEVALPFIVEINGDLYHTTQNIDAANYGKSWLYKHSASGSLYYHTYLPLPRPLKFGFKTLDNKLLLVGGDWICDNVTPNQVNYIAKYTTGGTAVFQSTFTTVFGDPPKACVQGADSGYYLFTDSLLFKHSKTGQFMFKTNLGLDKISAAITLQNGNILLSARSSSANSLVELSPTGTVVAIKPAPVLLGRFMFYGNQKIMALGSDNVLYKFSPFFNLIGSSSATAAQLIRGFAVNNDTVYTIRTSSLIPSSYAISDTSFVTTFTSATTTDKVTQEAIAVTSQNKVAVLSTARAHNSAAPFGFYVHYYTTLTVFDKSGSNNFTNDIAILSLVKDSSYSVLVGASNPSSAYSNVFLKAKLTIKNMGNRVLTSFKLNCFEYPHVACGATFYQEQFSGFSLLPGDTLTVLTNRFVQHSYVSAALPVAQVDYCFYVTLPDGEGDKTLSDNELCKTMSILRTGLDERNKEPAGFSVFPNPFSNDIRVESPYESGRMSLYNQVGILVFAKDIHSGLETINLTELSQGIYLVKVEGLKGTFYKKLIKTQ